MTVKPNGHLSIALRADRNDIALPEGRFYTPSGHRASGLQLHAERVVAEPRAVRQRIEDLECSEPLQVDPEPGNDLFIVINRGVGEDVRRLARCVVRSRVVETAVHVPILSSSPAGVVGIV